MSFTTDVLSSDIIFYLSFITATILGNYARSGTTSLATYSPSYVKSGSIIWSNLSSCLLMGLFQELKAARWFASDDLNPFFTTLTTGFCGGYSSYSTMMLETFQQSASLSRSDIERSERLPNRAYGIMEFLAVLVTQLFASMGSYLFGRGLAKSIIVPLARSRSLENKTDEPQPPVLKTLRILQWIFALVAVPLVALLIVLACVYGNHSRAAWTLPALFAIFGGYLRYALSQWLNGLVKPFPIGTFVGNQIAVVTQAVFQLLIRGRQDYRQALPIACTRNACHVVTALASGFASTLSTISTMMNEGYGLEFTQMLTYFIASISVSYCLYIVILGSYAWTRGLTIPLC
ncbi:related to UPF0695 membrane protein YOR390W [Zygosaccharomyces bailii]|nr:related to UPF0695 membrane protein YOR390W [Zygosaccharomyces bailii]